MRSATTDTTVRRRVLRRARSRARQSVGWLLLGLLPALVATCDRAPLDQALTEGARVEIPHPDLSGFEPPIRRQVEALQRRADRLRATADDPSGRSSLAAALGDLGNQYHAFLFLEAAQECYEQAARLDPEELRWHYYLGATLSHRGLDTQAVEALERALALRPEDLATNIRLGDLHLKLGQIDEARASFRKAIEIDPTSAAAHFGLGRAAVLAGDDAEAIRHFERTLELAPDADAVHYPLAQAYRRVGDLESSERHLALHGSKGLSFPDPLMQEILRRKVDTSIDTVRSLATQPERLTAEELAQIALGQIGDKGGAVERFEHRVATEGTGVEKPEHQARVHFVLGRLLQKAGRPEEAARQLAEALRLDPRLDSGEARLGLAETLLQQGRQREAERQLMRALDLGLPDSDRALVWHRLGELARRRGAGQDAADRYLHALEIDPDLLEARLGLASAWGRLGRYEDAVREYRKVLAASPERVDARLGEATALALSGRLGDARDCLERGLEETPDNADLARALAQILASAPERALRDGERAVALARQAMKAEPTAASAETLAMALAEAGRFDEAVRLQEELVQRAGEAGDSAAGKRLRTHLERYRAHRPCCG